MRVWHWIGVLLVAAVVIIMAGRALSI